MVIPPPKEKYGFWFPAPLDKFLADGDICPICDGWQQVSGYYCLCSTLRWIERIGEEIAEQQIPVTPADFHMVPMQSKDPGRQRKYDEMFTDLEDKLAWIENWVEYPSSWIAMFGPNGVGKTHILRAIKTKMPNVSFFISASDFSSRVFSGLSDHSYEEFITFVETVPILLLDDWGLEHQSSMPIDALAAVIDKRYSHSAEFPVVITSNNTGVFDSPDIAIRRIASRVGDRQICKRFLIDSADFRLSDAQRNLNS
jgi:hypothetical protein